MSNEHVTQEEARTLRDFSIPSDLQACFTKERLLGSNFLETLSNIASFANRKAGTDNQEKLLSDQVHNITSSLLMMANATTVENRGSTVFGDGNVITRLAGIRRDFIINIIRRFGAVFGENPESTGSIKPVLGLNVLMTSFLSLVEKQDIERRSGAIPK